MPSPKRADTRRPKAGKDQLTFGLVRPVLRTDGYCGSCNVNVRDIFVHRASEAHMAGRYRRSIRPIMGRDVRHVTAFVALRDYDRQCDGDDPGNSPEWDKEFAG